MHETLLVKDLINKLKKIALEQNAERIIRVKVKLGALSHMSPEHFREHFLQDADGTPAQGAELDIETLSDIRDPNAQDILLDSVEIKTRN